MCKFIGVEVLAANALIDAMENEVGRSITFSKLEEYGIKVVKFLENNYTEQAIILYNENNIGNRILNYSDFFEVHDNEISVKEDVTSEQLRKKFRAPLAYELLKAILDARMVILNANN
jgi:hypothetical protein